MLDKIGGRKVFLTLIFLAVGVVLECTIGLSQTMLTLLLGLPSAFIIGNGVEHATSGQKNFSELLAHQQRVLEFLNKYRQDLVAGLNNMAIAFKDLKARFDEAKKDERKS